MTVGSRTLRGREYVLRIKHTSILQIVNSLGNYKSQGRLGEAEATYILVLHGYEETLSPELLLSYLPTLNTMFALSDLFLRTGRKDLAKVIYSRALFRYTTV